MSFCTMAGRSLIVLLLHLLTHIAMTQTIDLDKLSCSEEDLTVEEIEAIEEQLKLYKNQILRNYNVPADVSIIRIFNQPISVDTYVHVVYRGDGTGFVPFPILQQQLTILQEGYQGIVQGTPTSYEACSGMFYGPTTSTPFVFKVRDITYSLNDMAHNMDSGAGISYRAATRIGGCETLNIYIGGSASLGFGWYPSWCASNPDKSEDAVVVNYRSLPGGGAFNLDQGDTLIHEVGHWLGLFHTFDNGCDPATGDAVADTPAMLDPTRGCPMGKDTCPTLPGFDPIHNYMDYADDCCTYLFTEDQVERMVLEAGAFRNLFPEDSFHPSISVSPSAPPSSIPTCNSDSITCSDGSIVVRDPRDNCKFPECPVLLCNNNKKQCDDGSFVERDPLRNCEFTECPVLICSDEKKLCPDGTLLGKDPLNNCQFNECPVLLCNQDKKQCLDGTFVERDPLNLCQFPECPAFECPQETTKQCPDGSLVEKDPLNNCEFPECPVLECGEDTKACSDGSIVERDPLNDCQFTKCKDNYLHFHPYACRTSDGYIGGEGQNYLTFENTNFQDCWKMSDSRQDSMGFEHNNDGQRCEIWLQDLKNIEYIGFTTLRCVIKEDFYTSVEGTEQQFEGYANAACTTLDGGFGKEQQDYFKVNQDLYECSETCRKDNSCKGFEYAKLQANHQCQLWKSNLNKIESSDNSFCLVKPCNQDRRECCGAESVKRDPFNNCNYKPCPPPPTCPSGTVCWNGEFASRDPCNNCKENSCPSNPGPSNTSPSNPGPSNASPSNSGPSNPTPSSPADEAPPQTDDVYKITFDDDYYAIPFDDDYYAIPFDDCCTDPFDDYYTQYDFYGTDNEVFDDGGYR